MYHDFSRKKLAAITAITIGLTGSIAGTLYGSKLYAQQLKLKTHELQIIPSTMLHRLAYADKQGNTDLLGTVNKAFQSGGVSAIAVENTPAKAIPVLVYHGIHKDSVDRFTMSPEQFTEHLYALKNTGYHTITPDEFLAFTQGSRHIPDRSILLTFDDGRKDSFEVADPILKALDFKATMFAATGFSLIEGERPGPYYLTRTELMLMRDTGRWSIQSHARQSPGPIIDIGDAHRGNFLSNLMYRHDLGRMENDEEYARRIEEEVVGSKDKIKSDLGVDTIAFSYPFSDYGQESRNNQEQALETIIGAVRRTYPLAFRQLWNGDPYSWNMPGEDTALLRRIEPEPQWSGEDLITILERGRPKELPFAPSLNAPEEWSSSWGQRAIEDRHLVLQATSDATGAMAVLDGSRHWTDYSVRASAGFVGSAFSLITRVRDGNNYLSCDFRNDRISIRQWINGEITLLVEKTSEVVVESPQQFTSTVSGNMVSCGVDQTVIVSASAPFEAGFGGIGFKIWDPAPSIARTWISNISVEPILNPLQ
jgi:peptidoglycan/xylan/chitin deacetylase (PgdA/CDA1 family)